MVYQKLLSYLAGYSTHTAQLAPSEILSQLRSLLIVFNYQNQVGGVVATIFLLCVALIAITLNLQPPHSTGWSCHLYHKLPLLPLIALIT